MNFKKLFIVYVHLILINTMTYANSCPKWFPLPSDGLVVVLHIYDESITESDLDCDGVIDSIDADIDGDGIPNASDAFPEDSSESIDTDGDGIGNNADTDDDNDGYGDTVEIAAGTDPLNPSSYPVINHAPIAYNQNVIVWQNSTLNQITLNASDVDGDDLNYSIVSQVNHGILIGLDENITYTPDVNYTGEDYFTFTVTDTNGSVSNAAIVTISVVIRNTDGPIITLNGDENITMYLNQVYVEQNATAVDEEDGNVSVTISGDVNGSELGIYEVNYTATDSDDNVAVEKRYVIVIVAPSPSDIARDFVEAYLAEDNATMEQLISKKMIDKLRTIDVKVKQYFNLIVAYPSMNYFHDLKALVVGVAIENGEEIEIKFYFNWVGSHWVLLEVL